MEKNGFVKWFYNVGFGICLTLNTCFAFGITNTRNWIVWLLWCLNLIITIWEWYETDKYYQKYSVKTKRFCIVNIIYFIPLALLSPSLYLVASQDFPIWSYVCMFCALDIMDIIFCTLFVKEIGKGDYITKIEFHSFIFAKDIPALIIDVLILILIFIGTIKGISILLAGFLYFSFIVEAIAGYLSNRTIKKELAPFISDNSHNN